MIKVLADFLQTSSPHYRYRYRYYCSYCRSDSVLGMLRHVQQNCIRCAKPSNKQDTVLYVNVQGDYFSTIYSKRIEKCTYAVDFGFNLLYSNMTFA